MKNKYYYFNDKNFPIMVTDETMKLTPHTFLPNNKLWENNSVLQFFKDIDKNKKVNIIDVGAQSGLYTLYAKYLPNASFFSFEPFKLTYNLLNDNIKLNNISNVKTFNIGLSDTIGKNTLNVCNSHNGLHTMGKNLIRFKDSTEIPINVDTIDNLFYKNDIPVNYIKIDTEGWELNILKGSINTIKKYKPIIQIEWVLSNMIQCNVNESDLISFFKENDYYEYAVCDEEKLFYPL